MPEAHAPDRPKQDGAQYLKRIPARILNLFSFFCILQTSQGTSLEIIKEMIGQLVAS